MLAASAVANEPAPGTLLGERYEVLGPIASGGMAVVSLARARAASGFRRVVAVKTCLPHLRADREFVSMFLDEARLAALIHHPNVVATLDLGEDEPRPGHPGALYLVMEYVEGETLSAVLRRGKIPTAIALRIVCDALAGLQAAHDLVGEDGTPLDVVHRDISPQNLIVGLDGITRVMDFGIAKARSRSTTTEEGVVKGKLAYMSPEQLSGRRALDRRTDVFAIGVVLWELLTGQRLFRGQTPQETLSNVLHAPIALPSEVDASIPEALDPVVLRALSRSSDDRFASARELAAALAKTGVAMADSHEVAAVMESRFGATLRERRSKLLRAADSSGSLASLTPTPAAAGAATIPESSAVQRIDRGTGLSLLQRRRGTVAATVIAALALSGVAFAFVFGAPSSATTTGSAPPVAPPTSRQVTTTPPAAAQVGAETTTAVPSTPSEPAAQEAPTEGLVEGAAPHTARPTTARARRPARRSAAPDPSPMAPTMAPAPTMTTGRLTVLPIDRDEF